MSINYSNFKQSIAVFFTALLLSSAAHAMQPIGGGFIGMNQNNNAFGSLGRVHSKKATH